MTDKELIVRLRGWARDIKEGSKAIWAMDQDLKQAADRIERLVEAFGILEDALQEVGDDYPGSGLQEWCQQQVRFARFALEGN